MPRTVRVLRAAAEEARAAWTWYNDRNPDAAAGFIVEYDRVLERVAEAPERWPVHVLGTRRLTFRRFPYAVIYRVKADVVDVVAVAHQHRSPGYWRKR